MSRRSPRTSHPSLKFLWRHTPKGDDHLFSEIREHCQRGGEVRVQRYGSKPYSIVLNGTLWLARPLVGDPIGSFENIAAAVIGADRHMHAAEDSRVGHRWRRAMIRNYVTPAGAALGRELARLVDDAELRARVVELTIPPRCASCAFRAGPHVANGSEATLGDALKCVLENVPFQCHEPARAGQPCSGWATLQLAHPSAPGSVPWGFSDEMSIADAAEPDQPAFPKSRADYAGDDGRAFDARSTP